MSLSKSDFSVIRCEFIGNTAGGGGAVSFSSGALSVLESTFSGNSANEFYGGAMSVGSDGSANLQADNLLPDEIIDLVRAGPLDTAMQSIWELAAERMQGEDEDKPSKPDDFSAILFRLN